MQRNYYAIIPANVRYDKNLKDKAKLLYGEITALCNEKGYCWASNRYFAELYSVSIKTISTLIKNLIDNGYIYSEIIYKDGSKEIDKRYLKLTNNPILNILPNRPGSHAKPKFRLNIPKLSAIAYTIKELPSFLFVVHEYEMYLLYPSLLLYCLKILLSLCIQTPPK